MNCEREGCGHPLNQHDPCAVKGCRCTSYVPKARKARAALITDTTEAAPLRLKELG